MTGGIREGAKGEPPVAYFTALLSLVSQDFDRAADVLTTEHASIQTILRAAATNIGDANLKARIATALAAKPASLRVSDLLALSDTNMKLLIDVHAAIEDAEANGADWARKLNLEIWRFLEEHVAAHAYQAAL